MAIQLPAHLQNKKRENTLARAILGNLGSAQPPRVSIRGNRFTLVDASGGETPIQTLFLDVVIVDANKHVSKSYREGGWDPDNATPPDCFSDNGIGPSVHSTKPQSPTCISCPNNVRGSAISQMSGKAIKACRDQVNLAVMIKGDERNAIYLLVVTPGSLGAFRKYMIAVEGYGVDAWMLYTRLEFDPNGVGMLTFKPNGEFIDDKLTPVIEHIIESGSAQDIVGGRDVPRKPELTAPIAQERIEHRQETSEPFSQPANPSQVQQRPLGMGTVPSQEQQDRDQGFGEQDPQPKKRGRPAGVPNKPKQQEPANPFEHGRPSDGPIDLPNPLQRQQPHEQVQRQAEMQQPRSNEGSFGIVEKPAAPDDQIKGMLDNIFALPT